MTKFFITSSTKAYIEGFLKSKKNKTQKMLQKEILVECKVNCSLIEM